MGKKKEEKQKTRRVKRVKIAIYSNKYIYIISIKIISLVKSKKKSNTNIFNKINLIFDNITSVYILILLGIQRSIFKVM